MLIKQKKALSAQKLSSLFIKPSLFTVLSLASVAAYSVPLIDFRIAVGQWQSDYSGDLGVDGNTATLDELGFDEETNNQFEMVLKHPIPGLPNAKIKHTDISTSTSATLSRDFQLDDITFTASENVETDLDITHTDFTLFYSPLNNWVQIDLGLTGRKFDAEATVRGGVSGTESETFDEWIPMLYAGARFELPLTGLYLDATLNTINYDGNELSDITAAVGYAIDLPAVDVIAELGYRTFSLTLDEDDSDVAADIELDGIYFNIGLQF